LFNELLIGVTTFFRDPASWERLTAEALPALLAACTSNGVLRAWVSACSTGEEAYSLAMIFREALDALRPPKNVKLQIFGTDLDASAVERARLGRYPPNIATDVSPERLARFFVEDEGGYRVRDEIRDLVIFARHNILQDPPFTRLDVLTVRNLLIYLTPALQQRLIPLFHYSLKPGGILMLGNAETIGAFSALFAELGGKACVYRRLELPSGVAASSAFPSVLALTSHHADRVAPPPAQKPQAVVEQLLLTRFAPNAVLAGSKGDVLYISGRTRKYLELPAGRANWNVLAMARDGLRQPIGSAFRRALVTRGPRTLTGLKVCVGRATQWVDVTIERIDEPQELKGTVMIIFTDTTSARSDPPNAKAKQARGKKAKLGPFEAQLFEAREDLRTTRQEMQTSDEELKSANEEMQSTNEELTSSKEEMQSMNEELQTLNQELQEKVDELSRTSNDMKNLLDSTEIAVVFLDGALNVRRFTPRATALFKLIPGDLGRPLADLASRLAYPELQDDAAEVLRTLVFKERTAGSESGNSYRVRIMPYRTSDNRIDGVVITFNEQDPSPGIARPAARPQ
jgi:chemotaxis methyl-accepting protein methylase